MDGHFDREGFVPLKTDKYRLKVISISEAEWYGPAWEWTFEVVGGLRDGCKVTGKTKYEASSSTTGKFGRWYRAVIGRPPVLGEPFDREALKGRICWGMITECRSKLGKPSNDVDLFPGGKPNEEDQIA